MNRVVITAFVLAQNGRLLNVFLHLKVMESCCTTGFSRLMGEVLWEWCTLLFLIVYTLPQPCTTGYSTSWGGKWNPGNLGGIVLFWYASNGFRPVSAVNSFKSMAYKSHANRESACNTDADSFYNVLPGHYWCYYMSTPILGDPNAHVWEFYSMGE